MLTTTVEGLWVLQVLTGVEVLGPELGLRPHLPRVESRDDALDRPIAAELREHAVIDEAGTVDEPIREWLAVLSRRDIGLVLDLHRPGDRTRTRVLLARFARWWAVLERHGDLVRLGPAGTSAEENSATSVIAVEIERLCGTAQPAELRPVTVDAGAIAGVRGSARLRAVLAGAGIDAEQQGMLLLAADPARSAHAGIVAVQSGVESGLPTRAVLGDSAVTVIDTPAGRLVAETVHRDGRRWLIVGPGSTSAIVTAVRALLRRLPAEQDWYSYRKVV